MFKNTVILYLVLTCGSAVYAQHTLSGTVTDKSSSSPVPGAVIYIPEFQRSAATDEKGKYAFDNLGSGVLNVQVTSIGYKSQVEIITVGEGSAEHNFILEPSATELEEVSVTSNYSRLPDNTPFSANTVTQSEIRKYSSPSVMGNLSYQPGIDRISIGNGIGKPVIRGLSFNQFMLYGQGTRIENQQWDDHHDLGLTDVGVENVEVVRGPAALIYGADALGGALIFHDEKPAAAGTTSGDATIGFASNTVGFNGDVGIKGTNNNGVFYGARFGMQSHTSYVQGEAEGEVKKEGEEEDFAPNSKWNDRVGKVYIGVSRKWGVSKVSYSYLNHQIGIIEDESGDTSTTKTDDQRDRDMEAPYQDVTTHILSSENTILTGKSKLNVNVAYQTNDRKEFEPDLPNSPRLAIGLLLNTTTFDAKWTSNQEKSFGFTVGAQGTFLKNTNNGEESLVPDATVSDIAGYGLFRYDHAKLNLLGGIRYDTRQIEATTYRTDAIATDSFIVISNKQTFAPNTRNPKPPTDFKKDYTPVSFSIGAAYHVNDGFTIKLNAATGFSAPNYAQLAAFGQHEGTYRFELGNSNLKVEQNIEGDLGFIWENEFITFNLGGYYNKIKDYIYIANTGDSMMMITDAVTTLPLYDYRQGDATIAGGEFGFDMHPKTVKWLDFKATYALISGTLDAGGNLPYIPSNKLVGEMRLGKDKIGKLNDTYIFFVVSNYAMQSHVAQYELATDGYTLLDVHIGAMFSLGKQKAQFDLFCTNLLDEAYFSQLSLVKYIGVRDMGRNIGVQIKIPFGIKG